MAVKIRLARRGRKKRAIYDIVAADARAPRDGRFIEKLGQYNPNTSPASVTLQGDRALYWLMVGAQPTDTARKVLSEKGIMLRKHLQVGVNKGSITQETADGRFEAWQKEKLENVTARATAQTAKTDAGKKAKLEAEQKINQARIEALAAKNTPPAEEVAPAVEDETVPVAEEVAAVEEAPEVAAPAETSEEAPATEEAPAE